MMAPPAPDRLEMEVKDFGPIIEAKVDLRPLTVFVGPSNTGKSYLAVLVYALHRFFSGAAKFYRPPAWGRRNFFWRIGFSGADSKSLSKKDRENIFEWVDQLSAHSSSRVDLPEPVSSRIRSYFAGFDDQARYLGDEIGRCFGLEGTADLIRRGGADSARVVLRKHVPVSGGNTEPFEFNLALTKRKTDLQAALPENTPLQVDRSLAAQQCQYVLKFHPMTSWRDDQKPWGALDEETLRQMAGSIIGEIIAIAAPHIVSPLHSAAFYLPADRSGVMHAHRMVVSALIERAALGGLRQAPPTPLLSGVLADFLEQLIALDERKRRKPKTGNDLAEWIEKRMLEGAVRIKNSPTGYPSFQYRPKGWKDDLPLSSASSMVSELAPVVLYLRHVVRQGDVLIVEEPESHLHPAMQAALLRQLAAAVQAGIRVIVTTHSEWLLEALANLVRLSELPESERKEIGDDDTALRPEQVGVWLFEPKGRPRGSVVREVPLDLDAGLFPSGFGDVAEQLHNDWAEITGRIEENR